MYGFFPPIFSRYFRKSVPKSIKFASEIPPAVFFQGFSKKKSPLLLLNNPSRISPVIYPRILLFRFPWVHFKTPPGNTLKITLGIYLKKFSQISPAIPSEFFLWRFLQKFFHEFFQYFFLRKSSRYSFRNSYRYFFNKSTRYSEIDLGIALVTPAEMIPGIPNSFLYYYFQWFRQVFSQRFLQNFIERFLQDFPHRYIFRCISPEKSPAFPLSINLKKSPRIVKPFGTSLFRRCCRNHPGHEHVWNARFQRQGQYDPSGTKGFRNLFRNNS